MGPVQRWAVGLPPASWPVMLVRSTMCRSVRQRHRAQLEICDKVGIGVAAVLMEPIRARPAVSSHLKIFGHASGKQPGITACSDCR
jgi:hypothetical protein